MGRILLFLLPTILAIYALIDCIQTSESQVRAISKFWWVVFIVLFPLLGSIVWLVAGKEPSARKRSVSWPGTTAAGLPGYERPRPVAPDDDPQFLAELRRGNEDHERMLRKWEDDLRRRERALDDEGRNGERGPDGDQSR